MNAEYRERDFSDRRHLVLHGNALQYLLERNRDRLMELSNGLRQKAKASVCKCCGSFNACNQCSGEIK